MGDVEGETTLAQTAPGTLANADSVGAQALRAKNARIRAEQDRQLLQNRINRLVIEEEKAAKRIAETRRRAKEIWDLKRRNEANQAARTDASAWMSSEQHLQKQLLGQARAERAASLEASKAALAHMRKEEVAVLRQMRRENEEAVVAQRNMEHARCVARKQIVKQHQAAAQERKAKEREIALKRLKEERAKTQHLLDDDADQSLKHYNDMAAEEQRLLKSLERCATAVATATIRASTAHAPSVSRARGRGRRRRRVGVPVAAPAPVRLWPPPRAVAVAADACPIATAPLAAQVPGGAGGRVRAAGGGGGKQQAIDRELGAHASTFRERGLCARRRERRSPARHMFWFSPCVECGLETPRDESC